MSDAKALFRSQLLPALLAAPHFSLSGWFTPVSSFPWENLETLTSPNVGFSIEIQDSLFQPCSMASLLLHGGTLWTSKGRGIAKARRKAPSSAACWGWNVAPHLFTSWPGFGGFLLCLRFSLTPFHRLEALQWGACPCLPLSATLSCKVYFSEHST